MDLVFSEIKNLLLANVPVLYAISPEELRFVKAVEQFCIQHRRKMWVHKISEGLFNIAYSSPDHLWVDSRKGKVLEQFRDPISLLEHLKTVPANAGVFLLLDFHEALDDPVVRRLLKDLSMRFEETHNNIIILSPIQHIPPSLVHNITVIDFPLPGKEELAGAFDSVISSLEKRKLKINLTAGDHEKIINAGSGLTIRQYAECLAKAVVKSKGNIDAGIIDEIVSGKKHLIRQSGLLEFFDSAETMEQVGGLDNLKRWISLRSRAFTEEARAYGLPFPKGILLLGVSGGGKSLVAKAVGSFFKFPLLRLDTGVLFDSNLGGSEERTRRAIKIAEAISPCVLWIDEIEKAMALGNSFSDGGVSARVFSTFLTWMQEKKKPVFVVATANSAALSPEFMRKGRFDEIFFVDLPGVGERENIIEIHLTKRNRNPGDFNVRILAENSEGFSGAEIEESIVCGLYEAFQESRPLTTNDILKNMKIQIPISKTMEEDIQNLRDWAASRAMPASEDRLELERRKWRSGDIRKI